MITTFQEKVCIHIIK